MNVSPLAGKPADASMLVNVPRLVTAYYTESRHIFLPLFPNWPEDEVPNGVHMPTWDSAGANELWTQTCGKGRWLGTTENLECEIRLISDTQLWQLRIAARKSLVEYARQRLSRQLAASGASAEEVEATKGLFDPNALTLGFARRFATYKRPNLLLHDPRRLLRLLTNPQRPVQLILAGKAHPADQAGQALIREWIQFIRQPETRSHAIFLSDYDMLLTEELVQGVDVWINTPRRPWEACGTSGMKVLVNGGINLSELDGWWAEAYTPEVGWALGDGQEHDHDPAWDAAEARVSSRRRAVSSGWAFGTFLGLPNPLDFMGDRNLMAPRWRSGHVKVIAAREGGRLIGSNVVTRWGSFGFFGPLTVLPEYWDRGVAQRLLEATMTTFDRWGVRHTGLFTFAQSAKHVALYQKFGYWPRYLTAIMTRTPDANAGPPPKPANASALLSALKKNQREPAIQTCRKLTHKIDKGLDPTGEIRAVLAQRTGDVVLNYTRGALDAFAVCLNGPGSEGGEKTCYVKFGAARGGAGAGQRFDKLLDACEAFASSRGATVEAGVNLAREDAYRRLRSDGYRVAMQGVAMQRPHSAGFNRADAYVIDDWR